MPMFTDIVLDKETGRHMMLFVNQQYDYLMCIYYDEKNQKYILNVTDEEAVKIGESSSGRDFDVQFWLKEAEQELRTADRERSKTNDGQ